ncbi:hypothetical protein S245_055883, partial [Arachis hypogaea]
GDDYLERDVLLTEIYVAFQNQANQPGSQCFPIQITGWPLDLMAYAYLDVSPPSMIARSEE